MHKRILLALNRNQFENFNYHRDYTFARMLLGGNSGNNVFQYSLQKLLTNNFNILDIDTSFIPVETNFEKKIDFINSNYDCLVFSPANLISVFANDKILDVLTDRINKLKIPVYAIGLGAQSNKEYSLDFISHIKSKAFRFLKAILDTGGQIGLRGYFSAEAVEELGFTEQDYTVIGCPSLFLKGPMLRVEKKELSQEELIVAINGYRAWNNSMTHKYFNEQTNAIFVCQEEFYKLLYKKTEFDWKEFQYLADNDNRFYNMYKNNRIKLYCDFLAWYNDLIRLNINFSMGCRIHGNIVSVLAGIPSFIDLFDSRVKELAEYFELPGRYLESGFEDPYKLYEECNYKKFNMNFADKYKNFSKFTDECGLRIEYIKEVPKEYILPNIENQITIKDMVNKLNKQFKVVFVAHEFGLYKGHGGIASYLYNICSWLLKLPTVEVFVITSCYDKDCDLFKNARFNLYKLHGSISHQRRMVDEYINNIKPNYVEFAEFSALGLTCLENRANNKNLTETVFVTNNHTATRECYEWSQFESINNAPLSLQEICKDEQKQMHLSDYNIAPSSFLAKYVKEHYNLQDEVLVFGNPYLNKLRTKEDILKELSNIIDFEEYKDTFNIILISRFEGRKQQDKLVEAVINLQKKGMAVRLFLAGNTSNGKNNSDYRYEVYKKIQNNDGIYIYDFLNIKQQEALIAIADLTVMSSRYENQPVAIVETVLRGIPVMGSIHSGIADYTKDSRLMFDPFVEGDLEKKLEAYITMEKDEKDKIVKQQYNSLQSFIDPQKTIYKRITLPKKGISV